MRTHWNKLSFALVLTLSVISTHIYAEPSVGLFRASFDPVTVADLETAARAKTQYGLSKVVFIPTLDSETSSTENFDSRYELLRVSLEGHPEFELPSKAVLRQMAKNGSWVFSQDPKARVYSLTEGTGASGIKLDRPFPGKITAEKYRQQPLLNEGMLPKAAARQIKQRGLYGRGNERGIHDLPESVSRLLLNEQLLNDRIEDRSKIEEYGSIVDSNTMDKQYMPENRPSFFLYTVEVPVSELSELKTGSAEIPNQLYVVRNGKTYVRFFIHPQSKDHYKKVFQKYEWKQEFLATPISSHRSLIAWNPKTNEPVLGVKVSLDAEIGDVRRLLSKNQIYRAAAISNLLQTLPREELAKRGILFQDEPYGAWPLKGDAGFSLRTLPNPKEPGVEYMPMFSLYSTPADGVPPIVKMIQKSGKTPEKFVLENILEPLVSHAAHLGFNYGLVGEPHEQNVLIELKDGMPTGRFSYRDLGGYSVNPKMRSMNGLDMAFLQGIPASALKSEERANFVSNAKDYIRVCNLFALQTALSRFYPQIDEKWLDREFTNAMTREIHHRTGIQSHTLEDAAKRVDVFIINNMRKKPECKFRKVAEG